MISYINPVIRIVLDFHILLSYRKKKTYWLSLLTVIMVTNLKIASLLILSKPWPNVLFPTPGILLT